MNGYEANLEACFMDFGNTIFQLRCWKISRKRHGRVVTSLIFVSLGSLGLFREACSPIGYRCCQRILLSQCSMVENAHSNRIFLRNSRGNNSTVLDTHGIQITTLYLKYNVLYYIATTYMVMG